MPFPMRIQPIDSQAYRESIRNDAAKPLFKSRLRKLFDRPFPSVLRIASTADKLSSGNGAAGATELPYCKDGGAVEFEPSSVCLDKMVQNFLEENNEKPSAAKCGRNRCNCFHGNSNDSSDDEFDMSIGFGDAVTNSSSFGDSSDTLKSLIPCSSVEERNLLADTSKIVEKNKTCKSKDDLRKIVTDGLLALGHNSSICKTKWEKSSSYPAGDYEYIDVIVEGERVLIDIDFRSEFEIARSTSSYKAILQSLPLIFVGKADRLLQIVSIVSEAGRQSLKKKGMHVAPWRKTDYVKAKWLSPHTRVTPAPPPPTPENGDGKETGTTTAEMEESGAAKAAEAEEDGARGPKPDKEEAESKEAPESECGEWQLIFGEETTSTPSDPEEAKSSSSSPWLTPSLTKVSVEEEKLSEAQPVTMAWQPPAIKPKSCERANKVVITGLASLLKEKP